MPELPLRSTVFGAEEICGAGTNSGPRDHGLHIGGNRSCGDNPSVTASPCQLPLHRGAFCIPELRRCFGLRLVGAGVPDGPFPRRKNKEMYIPFGIHISLLFFIVLYFSAFFFLAAETVTVTAAADRVNRAAHRAKLLSSPVGTFVRLEISAFSV